MEIARTLGADHVIDYTKEDFTKREERYDLLFDNVTNHSMSERRRILTPDGICVLAGIGGAGPNQGQMWRIARGLGAALWSRFTDHKFERYITTSNQSDLKFLSDLMAQGKVTPFVEKTYRLSETVDALRYFSEGHTRGKLVIKIDADVTSAGELTAGEYVLATGLWATESGAQHWPNEGSEPLRMNREWNDTQPIYRQLRDRGVHMILDGVLNEGDPLPSVRTVAAEFRVNPLTVLKAYQQLVDEDLVEMKRGLGMFVKPGARDQLLKGERQKFLTDEWPRIAEKIERLGLTQRELDAAAARRSSSRKR